MRQIAFLLNSAVKCCEVPFCDSNHGRKTPEIGLLRNLDTAGEPFCYARLEHESLINCCSEKGFASSIKVADSGKKYFRWKRAEVLSKPNGFFDSSKPLPSIVPHAVAPLAPCLRSAPFRIKPQRFP